MPHGKDEKRKSRLLAGDLIVAALLLAFSAVLFVLCSNGRKSGSYISVTEGGDRLIATYPLSENGEYEIHSENGYTLVLSVHDGTADVTSSDCPNKYCRDSAAISKAGQVIVCAPAGIMIKIVGEGDDADDVPIAG